jgi:hypothetical protein
MGQFKYLYIIVLLITKTSYQFVLVSVIIASSCPSQTQPILG